MFKFQFEISFKNILNYHHLFCFLRTFSFSSLLFCTIFLLAFNCLLLWCYHEYCFQVRDYRQDWNLSVNEPQAGNYYPVMFHDLIDCDKVVYSSRWYIVVLTFSLFGSAQPWDLHNRWKN